MSTVRNFFLCLLSWLLAATISPAFAQQQEKPNILLIMADDIGYWNISAYNRGMMGYRTPNIDRIASEGAFVPAQAIVAEHLESFREFPPRQRASTFSVQQAMDMLMRQKGTD
jgi:hypothetical protein